jgi:hypothetical protein
LEEVLMEVGLEEEEQVAKYPPPQIFAKVVTRYAPLVFPVPLHDLPKNYMKNLLKFTREGDLATTEHINFFDQFADILGLEHEDVYSRLLVQAFEGQVRTWFRGLAVGSIPSYEELENYFFIKWGGKEIPSLLSNWIWGSKKEKL